MGVVGELHVDFEVGGAGGEVGGTGGLYNESYTYDTSTGNLSSKAGVSYGTRTRTISTR